MTFDSFNDAKLIIKILATDKDRWKDIDIKVMFESIVICLYKILEDYTNEDNDE